MIELLRERIQALARDEIVVADAQLRLPAFGDALNAAFEIGGGAQQVAAFAQQLLTGFGELGPMPAAVEQLHVEILLELLHRVSDGGGHPVQLVGGSGEATFTGNGIEHQQGVQG